MHQLLANNWDTLETVSHMYTNVGNSNGRKHSAQLNAYIVERTNVIVMPH